MSPVTKGSTAESRFWDHVDKDGPIPSHRPEIGRCWVWNGAVGQTYHARYTGDGVTHTAHRWSYILTHGNIPDGLWILHHCDNPPCVRPEHLYAGTAADNTRDAWIRGRLTRGSAVNTAKLSEWDVRDIREIYANGGWTHQELADAYGISVTQSGDIIRRKSWAWVEDL